MQKYKIENKLPTEYHHVNVYGGDPWHDAAKAHIKNLVFKNEGKYIFD